MYGRWIEHGVGGGLVVPTEITKELITVDFTIPRLPSIVLMMISGCTENGDLAHLVACELLRRV